MARSKCSLQAKKESVKNMQIPEILNAKLNLKSLVEFKVVCLERRRDLFISESGVKVFVVGRRQMNIISNSEHRSKKPGILRPGVFDAGKNAAGI